MDNRLREAAAENKVMEMKNLIKMGADWKSEFSLAG
jgi:hypothetical protein